MFLDRYTARRQGGLRVAVSVLLAGALHLAAVQAAALAAVPAPVSGVLPGPKGMTGIDALHKALSTGSFWTSDLVVPAAGGLAALIGGLSLLAHVRRHWRHESRRW